MDGAAERAVAAAQRLAVQRGGAEVVGGRGNELGDPGGQGGFKGVQVEEVEQVAESPVGGRPAEEAERAEELGGLMARPLGDGGVGSLPAKDGGASRGEQGK